MRRTTLALSFILAVALTGAGCLGCSTIKTAANVASVANQPVLAQTSADEVALGLALDAGALLNNTYALSVETKVLTDKALDNRIYAGLQQYDGLVTAARTAHKLGDAAGFVAKLSAARELYHDTIALIPTKKAT